MNAKRNEVEKKPPPSWMSDLDQFADKTTFATERAKLVSTPAPVKETEPTPQVEVKPLEGNFFNFEKQEKIGGFAINVNAEVSFEKHNATQGNYRIPRELKKKLTEKVNGSFSVAIIALAEYALAQLEQEGKTLQVSNK